MITQLANEQTRFIQKKGLAPILGQFSFVFLPKNFSSLLCLPLCLHVFVISLGGLMCEIIETTFTPLSLTTSFKSFYTTNFLSKIEYGMSNGHKVWWDKEAKYTHMPKTNKRWTV